MSTRPQPADLLAVARHVAVVGMSDTPGKPAHDIPAELIRRDYAVIPVNPGVEEVLGQPAFDSLEAVPEEITVDIVNVFRPGEEAPDIVRSAVRRGAGTIWLQTGITSDEARALADEAGLAYLEDTCIGTTAREHDLRAQRHKPHRDLAAPETREPPAGS